MNILVTGAYGFVGTNLCNRLEELGHKVYKVGRYKSNIEKIGDLRNKNFVKQVFDILPIDIVYHLAAKVGGIIANNSFREEFYYDNTLINTNVVHEVIAHRIPKIIAIGTGCSYSKEDCDTRQLVESRLLEGIPRGEHATYAYSKRNMLVHLMSAKNVYDLQYYVPIPANIYGPHDDFDYQSSHVMASLIRRIVEAREQDRDVVDILGGVQTRRDFIFVDDFVAALIALSDCSLSYGPVNIATGKLIPIESLLYMIADIIGYKGVFNFLNSIPTGQDFRYFSIDRINSIGWSPKNSLEEGIEKTIKWYKEQYGN